MPNYPTRVARVLTIAVILTVSAARGSEPVAGDEIYACDFGPGHDANYDAWPDGWTRAVGAAYPKYLPIEISQDSDGRPALRLGLDGGGAIAYGPLQAADAEHSYQLEAVGRTEGLTRDRAWVSIIFYDANRRAIHTIESRRLGGTSPWTELSVGPATAPAAEVRYVAVGLHVEPEGRPDVRGAGLFRDLRLRRLPRLDVEIPHAVRSGDHGQPLEIRCRASGCDPADASLQFALTNAEGRVVGRHTQPLAPQAEQPPWRPQASDTGAYSATVTLVSGGKECVTRRAALVVVAEHEPSAQGGEFGWSLDRLPPWTSDRWAELLAAGGVGWIKLPLWLDERDPRLAERSALVERLAAQGVRIVGVLDRPPVDPAPPGEQVRAAELFRAPAEVWHPSLEGALSLIAHRVGWWQLGTDEDVSFAGDPDLPATITSVTEQLGLLGQSARLGVAWRWLDALPEDLPPSFVCCSADPPLTADELAAHLATPAPAGVERWVTIDPLPREEYTPRERAIDLARQMIAAKAAGAPAIFLGGACDNERGIVDEHGSPDELFVPWRTVASTLAGGQPAGRLELPGGTRSEVFYRGSEAVIALWADSPRAETLYPGQRAERVDLWGRRTRLEPGREGCTIEVGREPCFVVGADPALVAWQLAVRFSPERISTGLGGLQSIAATWRNTLAQGVGGTFRLVAPARWGVAPLAAGFRLAAGQSAEQSFEVSLPFDVASGEQGLWLDFEVVADQTYAFRVYRTLQVGDQQIELLASTRLNSRGELEVEQRLVNHGKRPVSFRCDLFARGRKRHSLLVIEQGPGEDVKVFRLINGQELLGQTLLLRAEEMDGSRVVNAHVPAEP